MSKYWNIVVIGLGSMGKRRIRLLQEIYPDCIIIGVDGRKDRCYEAQKLYNIKCINSLNMINDEIDCAFICTSPLSHASIITECLCKKWNVFTELNLVADGYEKNIQLARENNCTLFLSSTFLYREEICYIRSNISYNKKWNYIYHIGQYLPDWHPWENYKDFFLGDKRTNGCREILAIELPWIIKTFGDIIDFNVIVDKMTNLDIAYNDMYSIQFKHVNGNKGTLVVDVVSPCATRKLEVYSEGQYFSWNGTPESLMEYNPDERRTNIVRLQECTVHKEGYQNFIVENAYKNEIVDFFDVVSKRKNPQYCFEDDLKVLRLIDSLGA